MPEQSTGTLLETLSSRFELRGKLGTGSMGVVHRAFDHELGREVALKTLRADSPELFYNLKEEFRAAASIVHPNLIELYELFAHGSECFFTMELLDAVPFDRWVRQGSQGTELDAFDSSRAARASESPPSWAESGTHPIDEPPRSGTLPASSGLEGADAATRLAAGAAQLARAVAALHDTGRLHCDIKPSNILVTPGGRLVVLDFGLSSPLWGQLVRPGFSGTLAYAAPEQMWGGELTTATDWYSVGVVLFQALTGELPEGNTQLQLAMARAWAALEPESRSLLPAEFASLVAKLLHLNASERPTRDDIVAVLDSPAQPRDSSRVNQRHFVGRSAELSTLHGAFRAVRAGWLTAVDVHGASGIGKTELIRQFTLEASADAALVVRGQCRLDESVPYQALDHVIDELSRHLAVLRKDDRHTFLPDDFASLVRVFPVLGRLARTEQISDELDGAVVRQRAIVALRQMLWRLCAWRPLILWVDDANWGDAESQSLLCDLLREPAPPLLLILTHREANAPWVLPILEAVEQAEGQSLEIQAGPLDDGASRELVETLLGPLARERPSLASRVAAEGEHVPLFIGQLCRLIAETSRPGDDDEQPLTLFEVIDRRISALDEDEQRLAELVALIDAPLPVRVIAAAAELSADRSRVVSRLTSAQLLRLTGARPDPRLTTFHHHVRETVLARLDPEARKRGHRLLATAIERLEPSIVPEVLLHHWLGADEPERAREVALHAARAAIEKLAFSHAAALYRTALDLDHLGSETYSNTQTKFARALSAAGRAVEAGEQYRLLSTRAEPPESLLSSQQAAENFLIGGQLEKGMAVLAEALEQVGLPLPGSPAAIMILSLRHALVFRVTSRFRGRKRAAPLDAPIDTPIDEAEALRLDLCMSAAKGLGVVDPLLSGYFAFSALNLATRARDPARLVGALCLSGTMLACLGGRLGQWGHEWLDEATSLADASSDVLMRGRVLVCRAQVEVNWGRWTSVLQHCDAAAQWLALHPMAATWERNMAEVAAIRALEELGSLGLAWRRAAEWRADAQSRGDLYAQTTADLYLAFSKLADGDGDGAERLANAALAGWSAAPPPFQEFYRLRVIAYAELYRGQLSSALDHLDRGERTMRAARLDQVLGFGVDSNLLRARVHLRRAQLGQQPKRALAECERATAKLEKLNRSDARGHAALLRAGMEVVCGNREGAEAHLLAARTIFAAAHMSLGLSYVAAAQSVLTDNDDSGERLAAQELTLRRQGVLEPRAWLALHVPGFALPPPGARGAGRPGPA